MSRQLSARAAQRLAALSEANSGCSSLSGSGTRAPSLWTDSSTARSVSSSSSFSRRPDGLWIPRSSTRSFSSAEAEVTLTHARLEQLLEAEITTIGRREVRPLTLDTILKSREAIELAVLLHEELPVRYAQRINMLEALPSWQDTNSFQIVRKMYVTSFKELRLADPYSPDFPDDLRRIKKRHAHTNLLVGGFKSIAENDEMSEHEINEWLDRFFALRVSTNMLISHYLEIAEGRERSEEDLNPFQSSINPCCHPYRIASYAAEVIEALCESWYGVSPEIRVVDIRSQPFPFVPRYLFYIMSELLKNAARATIEQKLGFFATKESVEKHPELFSNLPPVEVLVSSENDVTCLRVSDQGGGIPVDQMHHIWSYLYTTAEPIQIPVSRVGVDAPTDLRRLENGAFTSVHSLADGSEEQNVLMRSPLAGLGCGLPLSRLYVQYLGGKMTLHSLPRLGTDVFVYLNSLDNHAEALPHSL